MRIKSSDRKGEYILGKGTWACPSGIRKRMKRTSAKKGKEGRKWNDLEMTGG